VSLLFQISPGLGQNAGFTFKYSVTGGPQIGFDVEHDSGVIIEDVCSVPFGGTFGTTCDGTKLGHYYSGGGISGLILFNNNAQVNTAYFVKDISTGAGEGLSHFVNSHHYVPEPATYGMLGAGLLALSLLRRRK
jgi:hypothetical protein